MIFQGTFFVGCLELSIGRSWIDTQSVVVFCVFHHDAVEGKINLDGGKQVEESVSKQGGRMCSRKFCRCDEFGVGRLVQAIVRVPEVRGLLTAYRGCCTGIGVKTIKVVRDMPVFVE